MIKEVNGYQMHSTLTFVVVEFSIWDNVTLIYDL